MGTHADDAELLAQRLKALSNEARIRLLRLVQDPARLADIRLPITPDDDRERPMTRQALTRHIQSLVEAGVLLRNEGDDVTYCVDRAGLFELTHALRKLLVLRGAARDEDATQILDHLGAPPVNRDALVVVRGPREGQTYPIDGREEVAIGRAQGADIVLDHDRFISSDQARIVAREGSHWLVDPGSTTNPTNINWQPVRRGAAVPLHAGDVIGIGMTLLVYRPAQAPK